MMDSSSPYDSFDYQKYWRGRGYDFWSEREALIRLLGRTKSGPQDYLLDAGAGYGRNSELYAKIYKKAILLDPSIKEIEQAKVRLKGLSNINYQIGEIEELPFGDNTFDCIFCVRVLHHLKDPRAALWEFRRTLKIGGFLILEIANKMNLKERILALLRGKLQDFESDDPVDRRSPESKKSGAIVFVNHSPRFIQKLLLDNGFVIEETFSVSNFRSPFSRLKILIPFFLFLDRILYWWLARIWFGPSIIFLAKKGRLTRKRKEGKLD